MDDLIRRGKVRYFGLSNFQGWRIAEIVKECRRLGVPPPIVVQPFYHALYRLAEVEILPACAYYGLGVVPYAVLARGVLTGKYIPGKKPPKGIKGRDRTAGFHGIEYRPGIAENRAATQGPCGKKRNEAGILCAELDAQ